MEPRYVEVKRKSLEGIRSLILKRDNYTCRYCGSTTPPFHVDHVYPVSKGGETTFDNLATACQTCNSEKYDKIGIWPRPIGYFESPPPKASSSGAAVFLMLLGVLLTLGGIVAYFYSRELGVTSFILIGMVAEFLGLKYDTGDNL